MAHPYHHALSSVRQWGGTADDYLPVHSWFDESKAIIADFRHRASALARARCACALLLPSLPFRLARPRAMPPFA